MIRAQKLMEEFNSQSKHKKFYTFAAEKIQKLEEKLKKPIKMLEPEIKMFECETWMRVSDVNKVIDYFTSETAQYKE